MKKPSGIMISLKALLGVMIAFMIAIPRITNVEFILGGMNSWILYTIMFILFIVVYTMLFNSLKINHGGVVNFCKFIAVSIFEGLMLSQGVLVAAYWVNYFTEGNVSMELVLQVCGIAVIATFVAVLGGLAITPLILKKEGNIKIADNIMKVIITVIIAYGILYLGSMVLSFVSSLFGTGGFFTEFFISVAEIFYGVGPMSMLLSFIAVFGAELLFIFTIINVKKTIQQTNEKYIEWLCASMIVLAVLKIFIEIFRLVLKARASE